MPQIQIHLSGTRDAAFTRRVVDHAIACTQEYLGKDLPVISTIVRHVPDEDWFIAGQPLAGPGQWAFHLSISITDETNTKAEKARFLRALHEGLARLRPGLHEVSYVHIVDSRAAAYGYGGKTQEFRHQQAGV